jgi:hypothetical protein
MIFKLNYKKVLFDWTKLNLLFESLNAMHWSYLILIKYWVQLLFILVVNQKKTQVTQVDQDFWVCN